MPAMNRDWVDEDRGTGTAGPGVCGHAASSLAQLLRVVIDHQPTDITEDIRNH